MYSYVVNGSEDGILGVFTGLRNAKERAVEYLLEELREGEHVKFDESEWVTFANIVDEDGNIRFRMDARIDKYVTNA